MFTTMQGPFEIEKSTDSGVFILKFERSAHATYNLIVYGHKGEKIWEKARFYVSGAMEVMIDLSAVAEGAYVMVIGSERNTWVRKLTIEG